MSISEACALWIEQQIDDELKEKEVTEKSLSAIGRDIAAEIERVFKAKVKPGTIRKKAERMAIGTNVPPSQNTPSSPKKKETSAAPLCKKCGARMVKLSRGKPPSHGLCQPCRKEELKTADVAVSSAGHKSKETKNNKEQEIIWSKVVLKIKNIIDFLSANAEIPPDIPQQKIDEIKDAVITFNSFFDYLEG